MLRETFMAFSGQYRQVADCRDGFSPKRLATFAVAIAAAILVLAAPEPATSSLIFTVIVFGLIGPMRRVRR
jgi:hypothetical protein